METQLDCLLTLLFGCNQYSVSNNARSSFVGIYFYQNLFSMGHVRKRMRALVTQDYDV